MPKLPHSPGESIQRNHPTRTVRGRAVAGSSRWRGLRFERLEERQLLSATPTTGAEFQVNSFTTGNQELAKVASDAEGDYVVVWESQGQDGSGYGIYAQLYNASGATQGSAFQVNTYTAGNQALPTVAMDSEGDFVVAWESKSQDGNGYGIYAQLYDSSGDAQGSEFLVNTYTTGNQESPAVAMDSEGDFVVTWQSQGEDGSGYGIYAQQYNFSGVAQGSEFQVNTYTTGNQASPAVATDSEGDFVVAWQSQGEDGSGDGIFAQQYNFAGTAQGSEFQVNTYTTGNQESPAVAMDSRGAFVVAWQSQGEDDSGYGIFAQQYNSSGGLEGNEFQVNTYTTGNQESPAVAMDAGGDFVVTWQSQGEDGIGYGIYANRYTSGIAQGSEFQVNAYTTSDQVSAAIAMDADGDFVVTWQSQGEDGGGYGIYARQYTATGQDFPVVASDAAGDYVVVWQSLNQDGSGYGIYAQRYNASGVAQGSEFLVNTYTTSDQTSPAVAMDSAGDFVVAWQSYGEDGGGYGIYAQRYNSGGTTQGSEFLVNTYTTSDQDSPAVAMDSAGDFVVAWQSYGQNGSQFGIYAQRYNGGGVAQGSEFQVNTYTTGNQDSPAVAMDSAGDFVVAWESYSQDGSGYGIYAQRYNASGAAQGSAFQVNTYTTGTQDSPAVAMDSTGDFVVAWESYDQDGSDYGIYARRYNASGVSQGSAFQVNSYTTGSQDSPAVATDSAGDFVVSWESYGQDGSDYGIYAQVYSSGGAKQGSEFLVNTYTTSNQAAPSVAMDSAGDFVIAWDSYAQTGSGYGVYSQRFASTTLTITGTASTNNINITFSDATHFTITGNGATASYVTTATSKVIYNGPSGTFSQVIFSDPFNTYAATQSFATTDIVSSGFEFVSNSVANLYVYSNGNSTANVTVGTGAGSNFFVDAFNLGFSYIADPIAEVYSELSGFASESVTGSAGTTYAYVYSTSHGAAVGNPGGTSTYTLNGHTSNLGNFPQIYVVGAADGTDSVALHSAGGGFVGSPGFDYVSGTLSGSSFLIGALYAANVTATAGGATDTATFYSYPKNTFNGTEGSSTLSGSTLNVKSIAFNFLITANSYDSVAVFESGAGTDVANLTSPGSGSFFGTSTASSLTVGSSSITINTFYTPSGGQLTAIAGVIVVNGAGNNTDQASITDSPGSNALVVGGTQAVLTTGIGSSTTINEFASLTAIKKNGSSDTVHMTSAIDFVLTDPGWTSN